MLQLLLSCWLPLPESVACVPELTFMEQLVSAGEESWVSSCECIWQHKWGKLTAEAVCTALRCVSMDPREYLPSCAGPKDIVSF